MNLPDPNEIMRVKHARLHPYAGNRLMGSGMDPKSLGELAESIIAQGIVQPLIVRTHRETGDFEIVCGHRRHAAFGLAAKKARLKDEVPCLFREYTDAQVHEIRLIENIQREGIHALEEAAGYRELLELKDERQHAIHTINSLATKIGKSVPFIYGRIKLLDTPDLAQEAMMIGKLNDSNALLIARIPDPKLAEKATIELLTGGLSGTDKAMALDPNIEPMSHRQAKRHISEHYMIRLKGAPFDQADETLVPIYYDPSSTLHHPSSVRIGGGSCEHCPFRTGNMRANGVETDSADVCTNTGCYKKKKDAAFKREKERFADQGQTLLAPGAAQKILNYDGTGLADHARSKFVDIREAMPGKKKSYEELLEKHLPEDAEVIVARGKKNVLLMPVEVVAEAARKAGLKFTPPKAEPDSAGYAEQQQQRADRKAVATAIAARAHEQLLQRLAEPRFQAHIHDHAYAAAIFNPGDAREWKTAIARVQKMSADELARALFQNQFMEAARYVNWQGDFNDDFRNLCADLDVDLKALAKETKA